MIQFFTELLLKFPIVLDFLIMCAKNIAKNLQDAKHLKHFFLIWSIIFICFLSCVLKLLNYFYKVQN